MDHMPSIIAALDPCRSDISSLNNADINAPRFSEPWHAQVFGLSMALAQAGVFSWAEWVETFSREIRANPQAANECSESAYYRQWSEALIRMLDMTGVMTSAELTETAEDWRRSYLVTEHGMPIIFQRDLPEIEADRNDGVHHHHDVVPSRIGEPVAISPANR